MKRLITFCLISMATFHAQAQKQTHVNDGAFARITHDILAKQANQAAVLKTTATAKRLIGYSRYDNNVLIDSARHKYRPAMGSNLNTYYSYQGVDQGGIPEYFDAINPLLVQSIQSDTSTYFINDGGSLVVDRMLVHDYSSDRNLTHATHHNADETYERFITLNGKGLKQTVTERDSTNSLPYADRLIHYLTYDNQNRVITDSIYRLIEAKPYTKTHYNYNSAGLIAGYISYDIYNGPPEQFYKVEWVYDGSNRLLSAADFYDFGTGWEPLNRSSYTYNGVAKQYNKFRSESRDNVTELLEDNFTEILELNSGNQPVKRYYLQYKASKLDTVDRFEIFYNSAGLYDHLDGAKYLGGGSFGPVNMFQRYYYEDYTTSNVSETQKPTHGFTVYPNPATDRLVITLDTPMAVAFGFTIYNQDGRAIKNGMTTIGQRTITIDVSALPSGSYHINSIGAPSDGKTFIIIR